jgi:hypothetical protein
VKVLVFVRTVGATLQEPPTPLAIDADAPAVAVLAGQERKTARSLFQSETKMGDLAGDSGQ